MNECRGNVGDVSHKRVIRKNGDVSQINQGKGDVSQINQMGGVSIKMLKLFLKAYSFNILPIDFVNFIC